MSAIDFLVASSFQIRANGDPIVGIATNRRIPFNNASNATQGPFTVGVLFDDFQQQANGFGYSLTVSTCMIEVEINSSTHYLCLHNCFASVII